MTDAHTKPPTLEELAQRAAETIILGITSGGVTGERFLGVSSQIILSALQSVQAEWVKAAEPFATANKSWDDEFSDGFQPIYNPGDISVGDLRRLAELVEKGKRK